MLYDNLRNSRPFFLIAGPCVIEDESIMMQTAEYLKKLSERLKLELVFKSSFTKANRSHVDSYTGPGLEKGLKILQKIGQEFELPLITDVHETCEVKSVAEVCDILQIPAFLSRQTALIQKAAETGKLINIKKGQFMAPEDMATAAEKAEAAGNKRILLTERGATFGYHNLVVDFRSFAIMSAFGYPVVYDLTHSLQRPASGKSTGGNPEFAPVLARAAVATGKVDGLFIECHPSPQDAKSDASTMLALKDLDALILKCINIAKAGKEDD